MTYYHIRRFVHHHLWINGHSKFNSFTSTADTVIGIGWSNRELGYLWLFACITQHCSKDVARIGLIHTCHHSSIVAGPAVGHLAVANGSAKVHRLTLLAMTEHLVFRRIHHHLRVHLDSEINGISYTGCHISISRCYDNSSCCRCIGCIGSRIYWHITITRFTQTYSRIAIRPCIAHRTIAY